MHFRHVDDEILAGRLKAQLIESLRGAPTHMLANVLRVLGRIESVAFYEGVRQGVVARAIEDSLNVFCDDPDARRPIAQHARVYGGGFTPLTAIEEKYIKRLMKTGAPDARAEVALDHSLAAEPLEMPPMTLAEALAAPTGSFAAPAVPAPDPALLTTIFAAEAAAADAAAHEAEFPLMDEPVSPWLTTLSGEDGGNGDPSDEFEDVIESAEAGSLFGAPMLRHGRAPSSVLERDMLRQRSVMARDMLRTDGSRIATEHPGFIEQPRFAEQPDFIEKCRDALQSRMSAGWGPAGWADVVFAVRDDLKVDPFAIDLSLSTDVGKSMLRSIGLFEIADTLLGEADIDAMLRVGAR